MALCLHKMRHDFCIFFLLYTFSITDTSDVHTATFSMSANNSYIVFPSWTPCINGSLSFQFTTKNPNGLILYTESLKSDAFANEAENRYLELTLVTGILKLRLNLYTLNSQVGDVRNSGEVQPLILTLGSQLQSKPGKAQFHSVRIFIGKLSVTLQLNEEKISANFPPSFGRIQDSRIFHGPLWIGGTPEEMTRNAKKLALFSVAFEPNFDGSIRNLLYWNCSKETFYVPKPLGSHNAQIDLRNACYERRLFCLNEAPCLLSEEKNSTQEAYCFCEGTGYTGPQCDTAVGSVPVTFNGKSFITYDIEYVTAGFKSLGDIIELRFKTRQEDAFLFYTGERPSLNGSDRTPDHITIYLKLGFLHVDVAVDNNRVQVGPLRPAGLYFSDSRWHRLKVQRQHFKIIIYLDAVKIHEQSMNMAINNLNRYLQSQVLYLAGAPESQLSRLPGNQVFSMFKGCFVEAFYKADNPKLNILKWARNNEHGFRSIGGVIFDYCKDYFAEEAVNFRTPQAFLKVQELWSNSPSGSLGYSFRTNETNGLLLFMSGFGSDMLAFELRDGNLYLVMNTGSGTQVMPIGRKFLTDGRPHRVQLIARARNVSVHLDGIKHFHEIPESSLLQLSNYRLDLDGRLFLGGLDEETRRTAPHHLWSAVLNRGFVGCMSNFSINDKGVDLVYATQREAVPDITLNCSVQGAMDACNNKPCSHEGKCTQGWGRPICDCTHTNYTGTNCEKAAPLVSFDGTQWMRIQLPTELRSRTEDIILRFKTRQLDGLLFVTSKSYRMTGQDMLKLELQNGFLAFSANFRNKATVIRAPNLFVADDQWHQVRIQRHVQGGLSQAKLLLDGKPPIIQNLKNSNNNLLDVQEIHVGYHSAKDKRPPRYFIGHMMHFTFNGVNYFNLARDESPKYIEVTASLNSAQPLIELPVTFKTTKSFAILKALELYGDFHVQFWFRTSQKEGLLLYNAASTGSGDLFALQLNDGRLCVVFNMGSGNNNKCSDQRNLHDNRWHHVEIVRFSNSKSTEFAFRLDGLPRGTAANINAARQLRGAGLNFNLAKQPLYVGGLPDNIYLKELTRLTTSVGFQGCLGSLQLWQKNGTVNTTNIIAEMNLLTMHAQSQANIIPGCQQPLIPCTEKMCHYEGSCIQQWHQVQCNCEMTSFTGDWCNRVAATFLFGSSESNENGQGLLSFTFIDNSRLPGTKTDEIAFGFQTKSLNGIMLHIVSEDNRDFIRVELMNGRVSIAYDMSNKIQSLSDKLFVSDNRYHRVRFIRRERRASLQVDNRSKIAMEDLQSGTTFDKQKYIYVGGTMSILKAQRHRRSLNNKINGYNGYISGLVVNSLHVLDIASNKSSRQGITFRNFGSVIKSDNFIPLLEGFPPPDWPRSWLLRQNQTERMQSTSSSSSPDEMVVSTDGDVIVRPTTRCPITDHAGLCHSPSGGIIVPHVVTIPSDPNKELSSKKKNQPGSKSTPSTKLDNEKKSDDKTATNIIRNTKTSFADFKIGSINIWIIMSVAAGGTLLLVLVICAIYRCKRKDEGSYRVDKSRNYEDPALKPLQNNSGHATIAANGSSYTLQHQNHLNNSHYSGNHVANTIQPKPATTSKRKGVKEWYV